MGGPMAGGRRPRADGKNRVSRKGATGKAAGASGAASAAMDGTSKGRTKVAKGHCSRGASCPLPSLWTVPSASSVAMTGPAPVHSAIRTPPSFTTGIQPEGTSALPPSSRAMKSHRKGVEGRAARIIAETARRVAAPRKACPRKRAHSLHHAPLFWFVRSVCDHESPFLRRMSSKSLPAASRPPSPKARAPATAPPITSAPKARRTIS